MAPTTPRNDKVSVESLLTDMLGEMESELTSLSSSIQGRMLAMDRRMETLEQSISDLMTDAGLEVEKDNQLDLSLSSQTTTPTNQKSPAAISSRKHNVL